MWACRNSQTLLRFHSRSLGEVKSKKKQQLVFNSLVFHLNKFCFLENWKVFVAFRYHSVSWRFSVPLSVNGYACSIKLDNAGNKILVSRKWFPVKWQLIWAQIRIFCAIENMWRIPWISCICCMTSMIEQRFWSFNWSINLQEIKQCAREQHFEIFRKNLWAWWTKFSTELNFILRTKKPKGGSNFPKFVSGENSMDFHVPVRKFYNLGDNISESKFYKSVCLL